MLVLCKSPSTNPYTVQWTVLLCFCCLFKLHTNWAVTTFIMYYISELCNTVELKNINAFNLKYTLM